jgi:hypothetical protein
LVFRLHQLEATVAVYLDPAIDVLQAAGEHSASLAKSVVHERLFPTLEFLDNHVLHCRYLTSLAVGVEAKVRPSPGTRIWDSPSAVF